MIVTEIGSQLDTVKQMAMKEEADIWDKFELRLRDQKASQFLKEI